jgi:hypothetical protein
MAKRRRRSEPPRTLVLAFQLRDGTTRKQAEVLAGMVSAAVDDAAGAYRALHGKSPFDGERAPVVSAEASVETLH